MGHGHHHRLLNLQGLASPVAAGVLINFSFEPAGWFLLPIGLSILLVSASRASRPALAIFVGSATLQLLHLHWTGIYVGAIPWVLLALTESLLFTLPFLVWRRSNVGFLACWLVGEWLIARFPYGGFGWSRIGYLGVGPSLRTAYWAGPTAVAFVNLLLALLLATIFRSVFYSKKLAIFAFLSFFLILAALPHLPVAGKGDRYLTVSGIQGNVPRLGLEFNAQRERVLNNHIKETLRNLDKVTSSDLIVWPENAADVDPLTEPYRSLIESTARRIGVPILLGGVSGNSSTKIRNISLLVDPILGMDTANIYAKQHLAPFGEYLPLRRLAEMISPPAKRIHDMTPGTREVTFEVAGERISTIICFEVLDDSMLIRKARLADFFLVQTNSATFGTTPESSQQLAITRTRSVEHGRPTLSISTSGISAFITAQGQVSQETSLFTAATIVAGMVGSSSRSPSDSIPGGALNTLTLLCVLVAFATSRKSKRKWGR